MNLTRQQLKHPIEAFREVKSSFSKSLHRLRAPPPLFAKIEITRNCNLNCSMCNRQAMPKCPDMRYEDFCKILRLLPSVHTVAVHGYGEPLVHPDFLSFVNAINWGWQRFYLVTNGMLLDNNKLLHILSNGNTHMIAFSIDQGHQEGAGLGYYSNLAEIVRNAVRVRNEYDGSAKIIIHTTLTWDTLNQMPKIVEFAHETGVDSVSFNDLTIYDHGTAVDSNAIRRHGETRYDITRLAVALSKTIEVIDKYDVNVNFHLEEENTCHWLWRSIYIDVEGNVYPCTDTLDYCFGNIFTDDFDEIWNGEPARTFRKYWHSDPVDECKKCISRRR